MTADSRYPHRERDREARAIIATLAKLGDLTAPGAAKTLKALEPQIAALARANEAASHGASDAARKASGESVQARTAEHRERLRPVIDGLRAEGITTYGRMADALNARNVRSYSGKPWRLGMVHLLVKGLDASASETKAA